MDNRKLLIETAHKLFKEKGYDAVSVSEIRKTAGLSNGTFYHYFKRKEDLLIAICEEYMVAYDISAELDIEEKLKEPYKYFRDYYTAFAKFWENLGYEVIYPLHRLYYDNDMREDLKALSTYERGVGELINLLRAGQERGIFDTSSTPERSATVIAIYLRGIIYEWIFSKGTLELTTMFEEYFFPQLKLYLEGGK